MHCTLDLTCDAINTSLWPLYTSFANWPGNVCELYQCVHIKEKTRTMAEGCEYKIMEYSNFSNFFYIHFPSDLSLWAVIDT